MGRRGVLSRDTQPEPVFKMKLTFVLGVICSTKTCLPSHRGTTLTGSSPAAPQGRAPGGIVTIMVIGQDHDMTIMITITVIISLFNFFADQHDVTPVALITFFSFFASVIRPLNSLSIRSNLLLLSSVNVVKPIVIVIMIRPCCQCGQTYCYCYYHLPTHVVNVVKHSR